MRLKSLAALGAPFFFPTLSAGGVRARVGVGVEDTVLAPESEFQLQAAYSPSPSPPLRQQTGRSLRCCCQVPPLLLSRRLELWPRALLAFAGLIPQTPALLPAVHWGVLRGTDTFCHCGAGPVGPQEEICFLG